MKAKILGFFCSLILLSASVKGQTVDGVLYTNFNNYYKWRGGAFDSTLLLPTIAASIGRRPGALRYNTSDSSVYSWTGSQWRKVSGTPIDTSSLSNRIDLRVKYSDTSNMLSPYLKEVDTLSLSNRINSKQNLISLTTTGTSGNATFNQSSGALNIPNYSTDTSSLSNRINERVKYTDTASMLTPYLRSNVAAATYATIAQNNAKVNISDTATMLSPYLRKVDTASLSNRINLKLNISDTTAMLQKTQLKRDTFAIATFTVGSGAAGDTAAFNTSMIAGSFYSEPNDTLVVTSYRTVVQGTSASVIPSIWFNDSINVTAGGTKLVNTPSAVTNNTTGVSVTPNNAKIPPNNYVFLKFDSVTTKPTYFNLTLFGYRNRVIQIPNLLLDDYSNSAAAYSLRKLDKDYTGNAIRVRRSNDNSEQDIGFVGNDLDTSSLKTFVGANSGFVTTWYDQSGNARNATQTTATWQPRIINAGTIERQGSRPTIFFDGSDDLLSGDGAASVASGEDKPFSILAVSSNSSTSGDKSIYTFANNTDDNPQILVLAHRNTQYRVFIRQTSSATPAINSFFSTINTNVQYLLFNISSGLSYTYYRNGISLISENYNTGDISLNTATIGARALNGISNFYSGNIQEVIYWPNDQSSNRTGIETNINSYFSIY
jgi:hypothetical protein